MSWMWWYLPLHVFLGVLIWAWVHFSIDKKVGYEYCNHICKTSGLVALLLSIAIGPFSIVPAFFAGTRFKRGLRFFSYPK